MWNKHSNFEQATRSPLIIYNPNTKSAQKVMSPTEFVDVFPTLSEMANLPQPSDIDGVSLMPLMLGSNQSVKEFAVSQYPRNNKMGYSFRTAAHRYTLWIDKSKIGQKITERDILQEELFDYSTDPLETKNHIGLKGYASIYDELKKKALAFLSPTVVTKPQPKPQVKKTSGGIKDLLANNGYDLNQVYVGATLNHRQLNTKVSKMFLDEFTYSTPENCAKQARIHPKPGVWDWKLIDDYLDFADKHKITLRIHGPISPQASHWAKADNRTKEELEKNMVEYFTALCKRMNKEPSVKWMDVVNETITPEGKWFEEKPGVTLWENPWEQIGRDENDVPLYITKAFEIANKYAPNISLVFNQHGGMEPKMWDKVKETILYLKGKGYRIDGLGWQAHLRSNKPLALDKQQLDYFDKLIDWAHQNNLDFHVTEIDYQIMDSSFNLEALQDQASAYSNILKVLLSKRKNGVVTFNTWGMIDKNTGRHHDKFRFIFDKNSNPKPAYFSLREAIVKPDSKLILK
jgi:GH35 family endo-1,4-beta-xylanase